jgi:hypothetical protein
VLKWDDSEEFMVGRKIIVNDITLEDLIEFQGIEFKIIRGYKWTGAKDYRIRDLVNRLFETRKRLKAEGNPLETVYKLILNNLYGKTIQKPIDTKTVTTEGVTETRRFSIRNHVNIIGSDPVADSDLWIHKVKQTTADFFNNCLLGSHILSMSKRIMNEVMCLAEDEGCHMYYQDTDSFFIETDDIPKLTEAYKQKYNRELIGKEMGQFHGDFTTRDGRSDVKYAIESLFIRKKLYCCKLLMKDGSTNITFRAKGINLKALEVAGQKRYPFLNIVDSIWELYKYVYNGGTANIDLCNGGPMFNFNKDFTVESLTSFSRKITA